MKHLSPVLLIFLMTGSFVIWLIFRRRTLKEEATHYEYDFRFWRNLIVGGIVFVGVMFVLFELYDYFNESEYERLMREFRESR